MFARLLGENCVRFEVPGQPVEGIAEGWTLLSTLAAAPPD